jgi:hypothetical protein
MVVYSRVVKPALPKILLDLCNAKKEFNMEQEHVKELKEIIGGLACPGDFKCYTQGLKSLCKAEGVSLETFLEFLEEYAYQCPFQIPLVGESYRRYPLRVYISKKIKK